MKLKLLLFKVCAIFCLQFGFVRCCIFFILVCVKVVGLVVFLGDRFIYLALCFCLCVYFLVVWGFVPLWFVFSFD